MLPLLYLRNTYDEFVLPKLLLARLLAVSLLALLAIRWAAEGRLVIRRTPLDLPLLACQASSKRARREPRRGHRIPQSPDRGLL